MMIHPVMYLTDNYEKGSKSNNYKLLSLGHLEHEEIEKNLNNIERYRDVDEACGFTLDKLGKNVFELRNGKDDELFRQGIKIKNLSNLSSGTTEDINAICEILFGDKFQYICETWGFELYNYEAAGIIIVLNLIDEDLANNTYYKYLTDILMNVKAGGVGLYSKIDFKGQAYLNLYYANINVHYARLIIS